MVVVVVLGIWMRKKSIRANCNCAKLHSTHPSHISFSLYRSKFRVINISLKSYNKFITFNSTDRSWFNVCYVNEPQLIVARWTMNKNKKKLFKFFSFPLPIDNFQPIRNGASTFAHIENSMELKTKREKNASTQSHSETI